MKLRAFCLSIATAISAFTFILPSSASGSSYLDGISLTEDKWLVLASEQTRAGVHSMLALQPGAVDVGGKRGEWVFCSGVDDPTCASPEALRSILAWSLLPACSEGTDEICIESLKFGVTSSELVEAVYEREEPQRQDFAAATSSNLLRGSGVPIFAAPNLVHANGGNKFAVMIKVSQFWSETAKAFESTMVEAEVIPFSQVAGQLASVCAFQVSGQCAEPADFVPGSKVQLTFRLPSNLGGWYSGRMKDPVIDVAAISPGVSRVSVTSEPVEVAALGLVKDKSSFTPLENMWVENNGRWFTNGGTATGANSWQENIFPFIENYRPQVIDKSIGTNVVWKMRTIDAGGGSGCLADKSKVLGIVTTNALGYDIGSPAFRDGYLEYNVAGLHYLPNGKDLVLGTYDLVMRSETARCLYGFSNAPVSATVTVVGVGEQNVASTIVSERNGWLKLSAYGFTFSEKEIQVKIAQPLTKNLPRFVGATKALSTSQKDALREFSARAVNNTNVSCVVYYQSDSRRSLAQSRAQAACKELKRNMPGVAPTASAKKTTSKSMDGRLTVSSR